MSKRYACLVLCLLTACVVGCGSDGSGGDDDTPTGGTIGSGGGDPGMGGSGAQAASGGTGAGGSSAGGTDPGAGGSTASTGCGQAAPGTAPSTVDVSGQARTFIVDVPAGYDPNTPTPVIFGFHGAGTDGDLYRSAFYGNLLSTFGAEYIVVHPDALADDSGRTSWNAQGGGDIEFFDAMLALLVSTYCVDEARVFASGHSSGGFFTNVLACERGDVLRGAGPISGGGPFTFGGTTCNGQVAAWIAHGIDDPTVDLSSGEGSRDHWIEANHCDATQTTTPSASYPCVEYVGCDVGFPVRWCAYDGDHNPPDFGPQGLYDFFSTL
jgi:polyhydroxybutyrate depolymerase